MPFITNTKAKEQVDIFYEDYGSGQPVILIHGWPLSRKSWEQQVWKIVEEGFRCISYDRRGFGGEVVRYLTDYGPSRIAKAALISSIIPLVKQKPDNPSGVPEDTLEGIIDALQKDRVGFLKEFSKGFYNFEENKGERISQAQLDYDFTIASFASPRATIQAALAWMHTDFRPELENVTVPTLIVHGDADATVPIETSAKQAHDGIKYSTLEVIEGAPHGLNVTHPDELNEILISFLKK
ncbi:unnamed protein product [Ectocarpus sp. 12 AP-2014]